MARVVVAIVGRPNVGKSTFFNRCVGARHAIVDDQPGVTRDRIYQETDWAGHSFLIVDTGGIIINSNEEIAEQVYDQAQLAIEEADVIVFMVDGKSGLSGADEEVANLLRRSKKPVILAVNKIDTPQEEPNILEFYSLGLGDPQPLSAMRGTGNVGDLLDKIVEAFPDSAKPQKAAKQSRADRLLEIEDKKNGKKTGTGSRDKSRTRVADEAAVNVEEMPIQMAIVGRPNVGKSSMVNALAGTKRAIVGSEPGTTRDAVDTEIKHKGRKLTLVDTAGIRRKSKVDYGVEAFSVVRSLRAIDRSDVTVLMLDATQEIADQDQKIASKIEEAGKATIIVINKWDLIEEKNDKLMKKFSENAKEELRSLSFAEVVFTSAITKQRIGKVIEAVERAFEQTRKRVGTGVLNQIINESVALVPPPASKRGKRLKIYYATQVSVAPPTFVLFVNDGKLLVRNYLTYLERKIREAFGFQGTPIRLLTRAKKESK